ncbi:transcription factor GTE6 isoform X1 [Lycium barbarum]|uniref:transcription factor GTE6 isoform X1 n=2 Tax=Lycium barbarum TaxID=112863 RepID=UPI00293ED165|nr:transcription factor GTE6 isoform X1 [Lycium barbarum]XP_060183777.1 transcription factor GTE6 isoform X1 [Lycium barbarum]
MEGVDASNLNLENVGPLVNGGEVDGFRCSIDELVMKVDKLEQRVNEVEKFYLNTSIKQPNTSKNTSSGKQKYKDKHVPGFKKLQQEASRREAAAAKRMQELMRQFGTILRQLTQHKWAWPFMQPVDVEGLGLHDYYSIIDRPMDFSTIKNQMEATDGAGYKHVREICADVRLVFMNAMKYNDEKSDAHLMAETLLEKFEEKWLQLLPKVNEEEKRREEEEAEAQLNMQLAQEAVHAKIARDLCNELYEVDTHVEELREMVVRRCRKISIEEKRNLGIALTKLSPDDLSKALEIVAQNNPLFPASAEEVELDIDAQSELTLWRLKFFVKDASEVQGKSSSKGDNSNSANVAASNPNISAASKRKKEICDALVKNAKKRNKKPSK